MGRLFIILLILSLTGCANIERAIVSPSESLYYKGNISYENSDYTEAIKYYEEFLNENPDSSLSTPAKLNLGMSYYYTENYTKTDEILKTADIKNENIKTFIDKILKEVQDNLGKKTTEDTLDTGNNEAVKIKIIDTYIDDFGSLVLKGQVDKESTITVNSNKASLEYNNEFVTSSTWRKGKPVIIVARDFEGNSSRLEFFPDTEPPDEPQGLRANNSSSNSVELEWEENSEKDIKGYKVYYQLSGSSLQEIPEIITDNSYEVVGLGNLVDGANKTFQFYLRAMDKMNSYSAPSGIIEVTLP